MMMMMMMHMVIDEVGSREKESLMEIDELIRL
jgi:hypothetical protein